MKKKLFLTFAFVVTTLAVGGLWVYQATIFEKSIAKQLDTMQESLKTYGVSFTYDSLWVSRFFFQAHFVNPKITGTVPQTTEDFKDFEGLKGDYYLEGEVVASFAPLSNSIILEVLGEQHINIKAQDRFEFDLRVPQPEKYQMVIQRNEYDIFGKSPFLSYNNIKNVSSDIKGMSAFWNGQKLMDVKDSYSDISFAYKDKAFDVTFNSDQQTQFYTIEKWLKGTIANLDAINAMINDEMSTHVALGPQDQKISLTLHLADLDAYFENIKAIYNKGLSNEIKDVFEKLFPIGTQLLINDFSTENKVYLSAMKGSVERLEDKVPIQFAVDFRVTDQWENFWEHQLKKISADRIAEKPEISVLRSILKDEEVIKTIMPDLQSFGKIHFSMSYDIPTISTILTGKILMDFKSDLYGIGVAGMFNKEEISFKVDTRNASPLMTDLENYVNRASEPFTKVIPGDIQSIKAYVKGSRAVLSKILEPQDTAEQSLDIEIKPGSVKMGQYDLPQIMTMFYEAMANSETAISPR